MIMLYSNIREKSKCIMKIYTLISYMKGSGGKYKIMDNKKVNKKKVNKKKKRQRKKAILAICLLIVVGIFVGIKFIPKQENKNPQITAPNENQNGTGDNGQSNNTEESESKDKPERKSMIRGF